MKKMTKKEWIENISTETVALIGSVFGWTLDKVQSTLDNWDANAIKYTDGKINGGRKVKEVRSHDIIWQLADGPNSYLGTDKMKAYVHECASGLYYIAYFDNDNNIITYAASKTGQ